MALAAKVDEIKFIVEVCDRMSMVNYEAQLMLWSQNIPTSASANLIRIQVGPGLKAQKSRIEGNAVRTPLEHQLEEMEAEMKEAKPEWLVKWDELKSTERS